MKALTFHGKQTIKYESVPDPQIKHPKDVIVKVLLSAICGSDLHVYHERETGLDYGTVMGHEFVGGNCQDRSGGEIVPQLSNILEI